VRILPHSRGGALWRFFLAAVIIIASTAAATAVAGLLQVKQLAADLSLTAPLRHAQISIPNPGDPQTILIIGSDHRAADKSFRTANTDTMMLVRMNGKSQTINVMSIPRDLEVQVPGFGQSKLNAAYSEGGPNLLIKTIRHNVFPNLHVNHIIDVNFGSFEKLVNAIGCVYADVDHRYYNNTAITNYSSINIQPGYQKLCGASALAFVRFRHTDSDLVRNARQQDFIRWAKDQYGVDNILNNKDRLLRIFGANTQTDGNLHTTDGLINLFDLVAFSAGHSIKQLKFPAYENGACGNTGLNGQTVPCYLNATPTAEAAVFRAFMRATTKAVAKQARSAGKSVKNHSHKIQTAGLSADSADGKAQAHALAHAGLPVYYPRLVVSGSDYCSDMTSICPLEIPSPGSYPRHYQLRDQRGHPHAAYRMTLEINPVLGQYYGVQGTTWLHPPLLDEPTQTKVVGGKKLELFAQGGKLVDVAWRTRHAVYWISNTLTSDISNRKMVDLAASLTR
jgi:LCP family protein required for cell wall assembly